MSIHQEVELAATPHAVYEALMDQSQHAALTGGAATISREVGGAFSCHDGQIVGRHIELVPDQRIVQAWRVSAWPEGVYSIVRFELEAAGAGTKLVLDHDGFPEGAGEMLAQGWQMRYWDALGKKLG
ncbi:MAG: SRPBCC domain-containing protein [Myxococcales bacterium]|nr:SRPBCC domain-containing protein [Myxococcales bacterium]